MKKFKGFTLIELVMSMGILSILIGVMTTLFGQIIDTSLDSQSTSGIDQDGKFVIARLAYDMQRASEIVIPATPSATTSASLTIKINPIDYTYALDGSGNLQLTNDLGVNSLNSNATQVSDLSFQRLGVGNRTDTVQVKFRLTSKIKQTKGIETKSFQTTLGLQ
ncbi:MAG TPA: prepilin-type N-terminal cleavage/methylation domain-containing protein [Candidatus Limnocylindrales bacterium]|nr:prepilin-type N-terminal cleavage/methylation domain-containing protein [Candidatus Limnocylindrales bacterium]